MFLRNFGLWVKSRNSERRSGSRELACFHCRLLRLGQVPENSLASTAAFFDSAVHAWALWRSAPGLAPVAAAVGPCALSVGGRAPKVPAARAGASAGCRRSGAEGPRSSRQGQRWWPPRGAARAVAPWSARRQLRVLRAGDLARARAQHDDGGNGEGGGTVEWKWDGVHLV